MLVVTCDLGAGAAKSAAESVFNFIMLSQQEEYREVVERRVYTVTGQKASEDEIDRMIETGEAENIFQKAILEQGRGHVSVRSALPHGCYYYARCSVAGCWWFLMGIYKRNFFVPVVRCTIVVPQELWHASFTLPIARGCPKGLL